MDSDRERDQWEQEEARREEIAREEREADEREKWRIRPMTTGGLPDEAFWPDGIPTDTMSADGWLNHGQALIVDDNGHAWGCPAYNQPTFTTCTCGAVGQ